MEYMRRRYLEDFIRESNSSLIVKLNIRSLEELLVSEEEAEEKDEGKTSVKKITEVLAKKNYDKVLPIIKY